VSPQASERGESASSGADMPARRWPASAISAVAALVLLSIILLFCNLSGLQLKPSGRYDPAIGGTLAEWCAGFGAMVAIPVAAFLAVRQLRSAESEFELAQRMYQSQLAQRDARVAAEVTEFLHSFSGELRPLLVIEHPELSSESERADIAGWENELGLRGWTRQASGIWGRGEERKSAGELLRFEATAFLKRPWILVATLSNMNRSVASIKEVRISSDAGSYQLPMTGTLMTGGSTTIRVGRDLGVADEYESFVECRAVATTLSLTTTLIGPDGVTHLVNHRAPSKDTF